MIISFRDFMEMFMNMRNRDRSQNRKRSGFGKILMLAVAAIAYSAVLSNLIDRSANELVVNAYNDEAVEQLSLIDKEVPVNSTEMLLDQKFPVKYLNTGADLLASDEMLASTEEALSKRTPVYVLESSNGLAKVMLKDSNVGYVRLSALSDGLNVIFDDCSEVRFISEDTVLKSAPASDAADAADIPFNEEVTVTGTNDETYWRVSWGDMTAYVDRNQLMEEKYVEPEPEPEPVTVSRSEPIANPEWDGSVLTRSAGVVYGPSGKETYYNLNMSGVISILQGMGISGEYWVRGDGVKMYGDYIIAACAFDIRPRGSTVETSLGTAICADTGGFAANNPTQVDIAVDW